MRILFIGCYRDGTSFGRLSQQTLLALASTGADITARPLCYKMTNLYPVPSIIDQLENTKYSNYDWVLEHIPSDLWDLATEYQAKTGLCLSGMYDKPPNKASEKYLKLFDQCLRLKPIQHSFSDPSIYQSEPNLPHLSFLKDNYVFYVIGKLSSSKRWDQIIRCYHKAFNKGDKVSLVFKTVGDQNEIMNFFAQAVDRSRTASRDKYKNPNSFSQPIVIAEILSDQAMIDLHKVCNTYIYDDANQSCEDADIVGNGSIAISEYDSDIDLVQDMIYAYSQHDSKRQNKLDTLLPNFSEQGKRLMESINE